MQIYWLSFSQCDPHQSISEHTALTKSSVNKPFAQTKILKALIFWHFQIQYKSDLSFEDKSFVEKLQNDLIQVSNYTEELIHSTS